VTSVVQWLSFPKGTERRANVTVRRQTQDPAPRVVDVHAARWAGRARGRLVRSVRLAFIVSLLAVVAFVAGSLGGAWAAGEPAPDITLKTENGDVRVADQKGKVVVLYFSFPG
jgi:hypothetical protein